MPRDIPIGNQSGDASAPSLLVNFRCDGSFGEVYYPQVGSENQTGGSRWRVGVHVSGRGFAWLDAPPPTVSSRRLTYQKDQLVAEIHATCPRLGVTLHISALVDAAAPVLVYGVDLYDDEARADPLHAKVFLLLTPAMGGVDGANTASYDPHLDGLLVFRRNRYMLVTGGRTHPDTTTATPSLDGYSVKWRHACPWQPRGDMVRPQCEAGLLDNDSTRHGCVEAAVSVPATPRPRSHRGARPSYHADLVLAFARDEDELARTARAARRFGGLDGIRRRTAQHWDLWLAQKLAFSDASGLGDEIAALYARSLFVLRTHADNQGAFLAAIDWDVHREQKETYSYCWMRDAGFACEAMSRNNCPELSEALFRFARRALAARTRDGAPYPYFMQKYCADGTVGSTWMSRVDHASGLPRLPIQQDETASFIIAVGRHHRRYPSYDAERTALVADAVFPAADWICDFRLPCGLPRPSVDLWEERDGVHLQTLAVVYGALFEAAKLASEFADDARATRYRATAASIRAAARTAFHRPKHPASWLPRMRRVDYASDQLLAMNKADRVLDAGAAAALFLFACPQNEEPLFPMDDVAASMEAVRTHLWVHGGVGGVARYQMDPYCAEEGVNYGDAVPGNPWIICTLWLAEWDIFAAKTESELSRALPIISWVAKNAALESGVLAEQLHPTSGAPLGVSPLAWSHSTFLSTIQKYQSKRRIIKQSI